MSDASINYQEAFNHLQYHADHMNLWEQGFVDSLEHQFKQKGRLSISQERHLFKLTDKYNMDKIREAQQWEKNYGPEQRDIAIKCALEPHRWPSQAPQPQRASRLARCFPTICQGSGRDARLPRVA